MYSLRSLALSTRANPTYGPGMINAGLDGEKEFLGDKARKGVQRKETQQPQTRIRAKMYLAEIHSFCPTIITSFSCTAKSQATGRTVKLCC